MMIKLFQCLSSITTIQINIKIDINLTFMKPPEFYVYKIQDNDYSLLKEDSVYISAFLSSKLFAYISKEIT